MYFSDYYPLLFLLISWQIQAQPLEKLAVLPLNQSIQLKQDELLYLTSQIQEKVQQGLLSQYQVMTQENIMTLLPPQTRLEDCIQAACTIDTGVLLGASLIMNGQLFKQSKQGQTEIVLQLQLYDTRQRIQKAMLSTTVNDVEQLEAELDRFIPQLLKEIQSIKKATPDQTLDQESLDIDLDQPLKSPQQYEALFKRLEKEERQKREKYQEISNAWSVFGEKKLTEDDLYGLKAFKAQYQGHPNYSLFEALVNGHIKRLFIQGQQRLFKQASYDWDLIKRALYKGISPQQLIKAITLFIEAYHDQISSNPYQEEAEQLLSLIYAEKPLPQDIFLMDWVRIQGGNFQMAEDTQKIYHSYPAQVDDFYVSKTEVTVAQYLKCVEAKHCSPPHWDDLRCQEGLNAEGEATKLVTVDPSFRELDMPVVCVDWEQAKRFSIWIGAALPTEEQWEYMAKSEGKAWNHPIVFKFNRGSCEHIVMENQQGLGCGKNRPWPVCQQKAGDTEQGLCDILGNAWEWVKAPALFPKDLSEHENEMLFYRSCGLSNCDSTQQVVRGGGWQSKIESPPSFGSRKKLFAIESFTDVGFRVVRPILTKPIGESDLNGNPILKKAAIQQKKIQKTAYQEELKILKKAIEAKDKTN